MLAGWMSLGSCGSTMIRPAASSSLIVRSLKTNWDLLRETDHGARPAPDSDSICAAWDCRKTGRGGHRCPPRSLQAVTYWIENTTWTDAVSFNVSALIGVGADSAAAIRIRA